MTKEEYMEKYIKELPIISEIDEVLLFLLGEEKDITLRHVYRDRDAHSNGEELLSFDELASHYTIYEEGCYLISFPDDPDPAELTDEDVASITEEDIKKKLETANNIYEEYNQKRETLYHTLYEFDDSFVSFRGDKTDLCVLTEQNGLYCAYFGDSGFAERNIYYIYPSKQIYKMTRAALKTFRNKDKDDAYFTFRGEEKTKEAIEFVTKEIPAHGKEWIETTEAIFDKSVQEREVLYNALLEFYNSLPAFSADKTELQGMVETNGGYCDRVGRSGFANRNTYYVYPNKQVCDMVASALHAFRNDDKYEGRSDSISKSEVEAAIKFITEDLPAHGKEWIEEANTIYSKSKAIVNDRENRREMYKEAQVHFCAAEYQRIDILKRIEGIELRHLGRSGFASRNSIAIKANPDIDDEAINITPEDIEKEKILSKIIYNWVSKQLEQEKVQDFITAFNANKTGKISFVEEGGHNKEYIIPDNYKCILSVRIANTKDHRQNLSHTCNNVYIDIDQIKKTNGVLHIDLPEDYIGMFIGKGGSHIKQILAELQEINPNITNIKVHEKEIEFKNPEFTEKSTPEHIDKEEVIKDYLENYASQEEIDAYNSVFGKEKENSAQKEPAESTPSLDDIITSSKNTKAEEVIKLLARFENEKDNHELIKEIKEKIEACSAEDRKELYEYIKSKEIGELMPEKDNI